MDPELTDQKVEPEEPSTENLTDMPSKEVEWKEAAD